MYLTKNDKSFSKQRPWTIRILWLLLFIIVLFALIRVALPYVVKLSAESWLQDQGVEAHVKDIELSLLAGRFTLSEISAKNKAGKGFSLGYLQVSWQWQPLKQQKVIIEGIEINALKLDAAFFDTGDMTVAGLDIKPSKENLAVEDKPASVSRPWDVVVRHMVFSDLELCVQQYSPGEILIVDYCGKLKKMTWSGELGFTPSRKTAIPVYVQGSLTLQDLLLHNNLLKLKLLSVADFNVNRIQIDTPDNISMENINVEDFSVLQRADKSKADDAQVFAFKSLKIKPLKLIQLNDLTIGVVELNDARAYLHINKQGEMDFKQWQPDADTKKSSLQKASDKKTKAAASSENKPQPFHYNIDEIIISSKQHFMFVDDSLKEQFKADINNVNINYKQLNSRAPDQSGQLSLSLGIDKHGVFKLDADVMPLAEKITVKGTGKISGFDLRMFSPLTRQHIGHDIKSGQLDVDLNINIDKDIIDSKLDLALHQFVLKTINKQEAEALNNEFGFPLNTSLSLLRDKDNTIRLDIPVKGDMDNPQFDPKDAIVTASSKAIVAAVLHYYTPFGLVYAAESIFDLATALKFKPVMFAAGESELTTVHKQELDKLAALLIARPGVYLTLCGISNGDDSKKVFPQLDDTATTKKQQAAGNEALTKEMLDQLINLAQHRSSTIKDYLVKNKKIAASRLIECSAEYDENNSSVVEISI